MKLVKSKGRLMKVHRKTLVKAEKTALSQVQIQLLTNILVASPSLANQL